MFEENGSLVPGIHVLSWHDFAKLFGWNEYRGKLLSGMLDALQHLKDIGCQRVYIDGSFVTRKQYPGDYDACWERTGMDLRALDPLLVRDISPGRVRQKAKYGGEWFAAQSAADPAGTAFIDFFQLDREGSVKGIVALNLENVP